MNAEAAKGTPQHPPQLSHPTTYRPSFPPKDSKIQWPATERLHLPPSLPFFQPSTPAGTPSAPTLTCSSSQAAATYMDGGPIFFFFFFSFTVDNPIKESRAPVRLLQAPTNQSPLICTQHKPVPEPDVPRCRCQYLSFLLYVTRGWYKQCNVPFYVLSELSVFISSLGPVACPLARAGLPGVGRPGQRSKSSPSIHPSALLFLRSIQRASEGERGGCKNKSHMGNPTTRRP